MGSDVMKIDVKVIEAAQNGCKQSLSVLTEQAKDKVFTFLYRMTLDHHLSEDLCQETMLNLVQSIERLRFDNEESLWAWLFRTAQGKVQHHRRSQASRRVGQQTLAGSDRTATMAIESDWGPAAGLFRKETIQAIFVAMETLRLEYRSVIVLRCMNEMSYAQIAAILGGTRLGNKMLFVRAKRALRHELTKKGMGRSHFLGALIAFAAVTASRCPKEAGAALIRTELLQDSVTGFVVSAVATKVGLAAVAVVLGLALITGVIAGRPGAAPGSGIPARYAHLTPLLAEEAFAYPSSIVSTYNPGRSGFEGIDASRAHSRPFPVSCADVLVGKSENPDLRLILPERHWVEVRFDGTVVDGPGPDLYYTGWYCPIIQIFLTDGAGRLYELPRPTCNGDCDCFHIVPFDIAGLRPPFEPKGIRVAGVGSWYRYAGFELTSVRARVRKAW